MRTPPHPPPPAPNPQPCRCRREPSPATTRPHDPPRQARPLEGHERQQAPKLAPRARPCSWAHGARGQFCAERRAQAAAEAAGSSSSSSSSSSSRTQAGYKGPLAMTFEATAAAQPFRGGLAPQAPGPVFPCGPKGMTGPTRTWSPPLTVGPTQCRPSGLQLARPGADPSAVASRVHSAAVWPEHAGAPPVPTSRPGSCTRGDGRPHVPLAVAWGNGTSGAKNMRCRQSWADAAPPIRHAAARKPCPQKPDSAPVPGPCRAGRPPGIPRAGAAHPQRSMASSSSGFARHGRVHGRGIALDWSCQGLPGPVA